MIVRMQVLRCLCICTALWAATPLLSQTPAPGKTGPAVRDRPREPAPGNQRFTNLGRSFMLDLPEDWRQLAPGEANRLHREQPDLPQELQQAEPHLFYAVGPVDRWLAGHFDGVYLYVVEQQEEWHTGNEDIGPRLEAWWEQKKGPVDHVRYEVSNVRAVEVGTDNYPAIECRRHCIPEGKGKSSTSLDLYVPTGGREISLAFHAEDAGFATMEPTFRTMVSTLALARRARGEVTLSDRLWTPILTGTLVGVVIMVLYRRKRRSV